MKQRARLLPIHPDRVKQELLPDGTLRFRLEGPERDFFLQIQNVLQELAPRP